MIFSKYSMPGNIKLLFGKEESILDMQIKKMLNVF